MTVSSTSGTDVHYEHSSGEKGQQQSAGMLNVVDIGLEAGASLSPGDRAGVSGVSSAPATPEAHRQDRGFLIHSTPLTSIGTLSGLYRA